MGASERSGERKGTERRLTILCEVAKSELAERTSFWNHNPSKEPNLTPTPFNPSGSYC